ncbi:DegT/DnrJ/EryC1/StrS family aminotransferase [Nocardia nova]|uniref:DegT/DnrJ/EryC1/StrS family aminotransferase n=1 Tax=Nocardia nova TaxID=37330 RepID=UPI00340070FC
MKVPRYNYRTQFTDLPGLTERIRNALTAGDYILGGSVERFEERFASYLGTRHAIGVNSGTDALTLGLAALGIGPGDEVITVANTFHATVLAVVSVGATPILVDCEPDTYLMDLDAAEAACGPHTRAIIAVHLFGRSLDMDRLTTIATHRGIALIEDCAQAVGCTWHGQRVGTFGDVAAFSFHPSKNLAGAGDGGALVTDDPQIARTARILRSLGQDGQHNHVAIGVNSKLDALQAIILDAKLDHLDDWNAARTSIAYRYSDTLSCNGISVDNMPATPGDHVYHLLQLAVADRDGVLTRLRVDGVDAVVRYPVPIHRQPAFAHHEFSSPFPHAEYQAANTLCLPIRPDLTDADIEYVCRSVHSAINDTQEMPV